MPKFSLNLLNQSRHFSFDVAIANLMFHFSEKALMFDVLGSEFGVEMDFDVFLVIFLVTY